MKVSKKVLELENKILEVREVINNLTLKIQVNPFQQLKQELEKRTEEVKELEKQSEVLVPLISTENELVFLDRELSQLMLSINNGANNVTWETVHDKMDLIEVKKYEIEEGLNKIK